jgi:hypothetical protein
MRQFRAYTSALVTAALTLVHPAAAQHAGHVPASSTTEPPRESGHAAHGMWMRPVAGGWQLMGMAQLFPTLTAGSARAQSGYLRSAGVYATQPAIMTNLASRGGGLVLRTTLNFEELTQEHGELTYGGWGEGFVDARHPHTLLHEAMLSANVFGSEGRALSLSVGKGFAAYGTDDPMGRPAVKFPTNHHLSQVLERFTANGQVLAGGWSLEASLFGGAEPKNAYDLRNIERFGDSWAVRLTRQFGANAAAAAPWEVAASHAYVEEAHHGRTAITRLYNANVRHERSYGIGGVYAMGEWSRSVPSAGRGYHAVLAEAQLAVGGTRRHLPYVRAEYATRPEHQRLGGPGTPDFFRYDHDAHAIGSTRWNIHTLGYGYTLRDLPVSVRPYVEAQHHAVRGVGGPIDVRALYGTPSFWSVSAGARLFFGGGPMRMGSYGARDPMTVAMRPRASGKLHHGGH